MYKSIAIALLLCGPASAQVLRQSGGIPSTLNNNLTINTNYGITAGNSTSTMTPVGTLFFASTATVSGSTDTVGGNTAVSFSTYTLAANALGIGDTLVLECGYLNGATGPTSPTLRPRMDSGGPNNGDFATFTANVATANEATSVVVRLRIKSNKTASYAASATGAIFNANGVSPLPTDGATAGAPSNLYFDPTASHTLNCLASDNGGGPVNFDYMKVRKE